MGRCLAQRSVVVGVCGGIAAYKVAELVRLLVKAEAKVEVIMTQNATHFIGPLTFEAICRRRPHLHMFEGHGGPFVHINSGQASELFVVAPATANLIGKLANGIADDLLSTALLAATCPILLCPSMNEKMYENPVVRENIQRLRQRGIHILEPSSGELACGATGPGRLPEPAQILTEIEYLLSPKDLFGLKILVTAGPTREFLDPVRFISNPSSGKMGYLLASAARQRGAEVDLISGPSNLNPPSGVMFTMVTSAREMREKVMEHMKNIDVVIKAAAVSDFRPKEFVGQKVKKDEAKRLIELEENPDILKELGQIKDKGGFILVGFAAESEDLLANAKKKLISKNLDMIVANDISSERTGFQADTNQVKILFPDGTIEETPLMSKEEIAHLLLDKVKGILKREGRWVLEA